VGSGRPSASGSVASSRQASSEKSCRSDSATSSAVTVPISAFSKSQRWAADIGSRCSETRSFIAASTVRASRVLSVRAACSAEASMALRASSSSCGRMPCSRARLTSTASVRSISRQFSGAPLASASRYVQTFQRVLLWREAL
jgi:hypothetical protein